MNDEYAAKTICVTGPQSQPAASLPVNLTHLIRNRLCQYSRLAIDNFTSRGCGTGKKASRVRYPSLARDNRESSLGAFGVHAWWRLFEIKTSTD